MPEPSTRRKSISSAQAARNSSTARGGRRGVWSGILDLLSRILSDNSTLERDRESHSRGKLRKRKLGETGGKKGGYRGSNL